MTEQVPDHERSASQRFDLSPRLVAVEVAGADASRFLQAQLSCDVTGLGSERAAWGAYLSPQGRVLATLLVIPAGERYFLLLHPALVEPISDRLRRYVLRDDVTLVPVPLAVSGSGRAVPIDGPLDLSRLPLSAHDRGWGVSLPDRRIIHLGPGAGSEPAEAWWRADLVQGIAVIEPATSDRHIPQALGLDRIGAVSFTKGCYPGQEIVARVHYLGRARRTLSLLRGPREPRPAEELLDATGERAGEVIAAAPGDEGFLVLAVMTGQPTAVVDATGKPLECLTRFG